MPANKNIADETYTDQETRRRRDAVIKRMLNTPPKPHSEMKIDKRKNGGPRRSKKAK